MSDITRQRRRAANRCQDCGAKVEVRGRCSLHARMHAAKEKEEWDRRGFSGLCPRCGKRPPLADAKSCFECGFGMAKEEVKDWVDLLEKHPRNWKKVR